MPTSKTWRFRTHRIVFIQQFLAELYANAILLFIFFSINCISCGVRYVRFVYRVQRREAPSTLPASGTWRRCRQVASHPIWQNGLAVTAYAARWRDACHRHDGGLYVDVNENATTARYVRGSGAKSLQQSAQWVDVLNPRREVALGTHAV